MLPDYKANNSDRLQKCNSIIYNPTVTYYNILDIHILISLFSDLQFDI